jgi:hypothetical protein
MAAQLLDNLLDDTRVGSDRLYFVTWNKAAVSISQEEFQQIKALADDLSSVRSKQLNRPKLSYSWNLDTRRHTCLAVNGTVLSRSCSLTYAPGWIKM